MGDGHSRVHQFRQRGHAHFHRDSHNRADINVGTTRVAPFVDARRTGNCGADGGPEVREISDVGAGRIDCRQCTACFDERRLR